MKQQRYVSFSVIVLLCLALVTACSSGNNTPAGNSGGAGSSPNDSVRPVTLKLSTWQMDQEGYGQFWKEAIAAFQQEYNHITIEPINYAPADYSSRVLVDITAGSPADLLTFAGFDFAQFHAMNAFEPLDGIVDVNEADFNENIWNFSKIDGKLMAYPIMARTMQLLYNKQMFEAAGIDAVPTNPDEFIAAARQLTVKEGNVTSQYGFGFETNNNRYLYEDVLLWVLGFDGKLAEQGAPTINTPANAEAVAFMRQMITEGVSPQGIDKSDVRLGFANGNIAMLIDGAWILPLVETHSPELVEHIGVAPTPFASQATTGGAMNFIGISERSGHQQEAASFIEFIAQPQWQLRWFELTNTLPAGNGIITDDIIANNAYLPEFLKGLDNVVAIPPEGLEDQYNKFSDSVNNYSVKALFFDGDVAAVLDEAQAEAEKELR